MPRILLALTLWSFPFFANAQNVSSVRFDTLVNQFVNKLKAEQVDTICIYENYLPSCLLPVKEHDSCDQLFGFHVGILWLKDGQAYMTKKFGCTNYPVTKIDAHFAWNYLFSNWSTIREE